MTECASVHRLDLFQCGFFLALKYSSYIGICICTQRHYIEESAYMKKYTLKSLSTVKISKLIWIRCRHNLKERCTNQYVYEPNNHLAFKQCYKIMAGYR